MRRYLGFFTMVAVLGLGACSSGGQNAASPQTVTVTLSPSTTTVPASPVTVTVTSTQSPSSPSSSPSSPDPGDGHGMKIGAALPISSSSRLDSSQLGEGTVTLLAVKDKDRCAESYCSVTKGKRLYSIQVTYRGTSGEISYNPYDWSLIDAEGQQYSEQYHSAAALGQRLSSGDVGTGRTVKGVVTFEVPSSVRVTMVDFSNIGDWKVG